jgi:uncharacterized protein YndB with AHSA1/START domain
MNTHDDRSVDLSVDVHGSPEEVWEAIATGPGLSVWFVPADIDGDTIALHHPNGIEQTGTITARERPHRFRFEFDGFTPSEGAEPRRMALEILVEAESGGTCVVRLVNSGFGTGEDWDRQLELSQSGWERCLAALRDHLAR